MDIFDFFNSIVNSIIKPKPKAQMRILHGNSVIVNIGYRADDSIGMTDYKRYYKVKKGKIYRKLIKHMPRNEQVNFFNTYELIPITDFVYLVITEKPMCRSQQMPTRIYRINLKKANKPFKKLRVY